MKPITPSTPPPALQLKSLPSRQRVPAPANEEQLAAALKFHWPFIKSELKENYLCLTDDDLIFAEGHELDFLEHLERKTGRDRGELQRLIMQNGGRSPGLKSPATHPSLV